MTTFVGRHAELRRLRDWQGVAGDAPGRLAIIHGPAGEGKTRLVGELIRSAPGPTLVYAAERGDADCQRAAFVAQTSMLPRPEPFVDILTPDWDTVFRLLADAVDDAPFIVVLDNVDRLAEADPGFVPALRRAWSTYLAARPLLLVVVGREPIHDVPGSLLVPVHPFTPAELAHILGLDAAAALETAVATGGHADIVAQWPPGADVPTAIETMLLRSPSLFEVRAELSAARDDSLVAPERRVIGALGALARSRVALATAAGLPPATLDRAVTSLRQRRVVEVHRPLSDRQSREARYQLADPYLRTWAEVIAPVREEIARGDVDVAISRVREMWPQWRLVPLRWLVRGAMDRLAAAGHLPGTDAVGGYWTRFDDVQVDLVGVGDGVTFVGGIRWDRGAPFDHPDLAALIAVREKVPGAGAMTPLVGVTLAGSTVGEGLAAVLGPDELLTAWQE